MKIAFSRSTLNHALATVAPALPRKATRPELAGIHITTADDHATLTATDGSTTITTTIPCADNADINTQDGTILVPGRVLTSLVANLPAKPIILTAAGGVLQATCGSARFSMQLMTVEDFPPSPNTPDAVGEISGHDLAHAIGQVATASSGDDTLPMLTGVKITAGDGHLTMQATDRFRLHTRTLPWDGANLDILAPATTLRDAAKLIGSQPATILANDHQLGFSTADTTIISRRIDADYPKTASLIPTTCTTAARVDKATLLDAVKRVSTIGDANAPIHLKFEDGTLTIESADQNNSVSDQIRCGLLGHAVTVGFNSHYLRDAAGVIDTDHLVFTMTGNARQITIYPDVEIEPAETMNAPISDTVALLMPVRLPG